MTRIGIYFGSTTGATERAADRIAANLASDGLAVDVVDVAEFHLDEMETFDFLIFGIPTWNVGQLQADWESALDEMDELNLSGKKVAIFGLGDQQGYPETFVDAIFFLADRARERGGEIVGHWSTDGYEFEASWAVEEGRFLGLVLDNESQGHLTNDRIDRWCGQLRTELPLIGSEASR
ncbi:MAG: flavodoxin [Caldilineaceae bacterium]|nr:flavodoxin [Caldilineaceae bacterium]